MSIEFSTERTLHFEGQDQPELLSIKLREWSLEKIIVKRLFNLRRKRTPVPHFRPKQIVKVVKPYAYPIK